MASWEQVGRTPDEFVRSMELFAGHLAWLIMSEAPTKTSFGIGDTIVHAQIEPNGLGLDHRVWDQVTITVNGVSAQVGNRHGGCRALAHAFAPELARAKDRAASDAAIQAQIEATAKDKARGK